MTAPGILPEVLDGAAVGIFGILLSAAFCPIRWTGKKRWALVGCTAGLLALQGMFYFGASPTAAKYLYPLITHLPLYVVLVLLSGQKVWPLVAVLTAYLCCQVRRWAALAVALFFPQHPAGGRAAVPSAAAAVVHPVPCALHAAAFPLPGLGAVPVWHRTVGELSF